GAGPSRSRRGRAAAAGTARTGAPGTRPARRRVRAADGSCGPQPRSGRRPEGSSGTPADRAGRARGRPARSAPRRGRPLKTVFAVDGGGSKTDAALVREDGVLLGFARGPLSHSQIIGVGPSADVVDSLAAEVGAPADLAVLLLAGLDFPDEEDAYQAAAEGRGWATE